MSRRQNDHRTSDTNPKLQEDDRINGTQERIEDADFEQLAQSRIEQDTDYELESDDMQAHIAEIERLLDAEGITDPRERAEIVRMMTSQEGEYEGAPDAGVNEFETAESLEGESLSEQDYFEATEQDRDNLQTIERDQDSHSEVDLVEELSDEEALERARSSANPADVAQAARKRFGDRLPENALREDEYRAYERMYGAPLPWSAESELSQDEIEALAAEEERILAEESDQLQKEGLNGSWSDVAGALRSAEADEGAEQDMAEEEEDEIIEVGRGWREGPDDVKLRAEIQRAMELGLAPFSEADPEPWAEEEEVEQEDEGTKAHPFTVHSRSGANPSTIAIPKDSLAGPTSVLLADISNKHLYEAAEKAFGGKGLPYSTGSPASSKSMPQKPIPLFAGSTKMSNIEADVFLAALAPGIYASAMSALVEVRKRLGTAWIEDLLTKEGGANVLDVGGGGAGILAWRDVVQAEWSRMHAGVGEADPAKFPPAPMGKSTVLTGSDTLRFRSAVLLDNTTFLPRLPDYVHVKDKFSEQRKRFDVIIAPHTLWHIGDDYLRRQYVENLWSLLSPTGGVLILMEKGVPRGFEVIAGARAHLLKNLFAPGPDQPASDDPRRWHAGTIVAPCTNQEACPMYPIPGISRNRQDFCHFSQRYIRPKYFQRMLGAGRRNHEDVKFSYVAVRKGVREEDVKEVRGARATDRAFAGYDVFDEDLSGVEGSYRTGVTARSVESDASSSAEGEDGHRVQQQEAQEALITPAPTVSPPNPLTLPRLILPPLKRQGHIILDVCTPHGTLERWTVPKSFGKTAYRDARKSKWGDLWALGAKVRIPKNVRLGTEGGALGKGGKIKSAAKGEAAKKKKGGAGRKSATGEDAMSGNSHMEEDGVVRGEQDFLAELEDIRAQEASERVVKRREEKARGREKARLRKRRERVGIMGGVGI